MGTRWCVRSFQDFLLLKEYRPLDYNLSTTEVEIVSITASWDQVSDAAMVMSSLSLMRL